MLTLIQTKYSLIIIMGKASADTYCITNLKFKIVVAL